MAEVNSENEYISYSASSMKLFIPSVDDTEAIAFRFHIILNELGSEAFSEIYNWFYRQSLEKVEVNIDKYKISEFEVWLCFLSLVSEIMGQSVKRTRFYEVVEGVFPLRDDFTGNIFTIGTRDRYPYIPKLREVSSFSAAYVRAKLAVFELLSVKEQKEYCLKELYFFSQKYSESVGLTIDIDEASLSDEFINRMFILNFYKIYNRVKELTNAKDYDEICTEFKLSEEHPCRWEPPMKVSFEIMKSMGLVGNISFRAFQAKIKKIQNIYGVSGTVGRPRASEEAGELLPAVLTGPYILSLDLMNACINFEKYKIIKKRGDYLLALETIKSNLELKQYLHSKSIPKLLKILGK